MSEAFLKWFEDKYGHKYGEYEEDIDVFAAYTAGLIRAAEITEDMSTKRGPCSDMYEAGYVEAQSEIADTIRKEAG